MNKEPSEIYDEALIKLRSELKSHRGYAPRIARLLKVKPSDVYNVAYGRKKSPNILKELVIEAKKTPSDESFDIINSYLTGVAA